MCSRDRPAVGIPLAAGVYYPFTGWLFNPMVAAAVGALLIAAVLVFFFGPRRRVGRAEGIAASRRRS